MLSYKNFNVYSIVSCGLSELWSPSQNETSLGPPYAAWFFSVWSIGISSSSQAWMKNAGILHLGASSTGLSVFRSKPPVAWLIYITTWGHIICRNSYGTPIFYVTKLEATSEKFENELSITKHDIGSGDWSLSYISAVAPPILLPHKAIFEVFP